MRSGLDVHWVPCFDGGHPKNEGRASFWIAPRRDTFAGCSPRVLRYFLYALEKRGGDPIAFLDAPMAEGERERLLAGSKELWCTAIFTFLSGRKTVHDGKRVVALPPAKAAGLPERKVFGFSSVDAAIDDAGRIRYGAAPDSRRVQRFEILDRKGYAEAMTSMTAALLEGLDRTKEADPGSR
jgi:hypothetical protein